MKSEKRKATYCLTITLQFVHHFKIDLFHLLNDHNENRFLIKMPYVHPSISLNSRRERSWFFMVVS